MKTVRASWNEYFMDIAYTVASRSTCRSRDVGAIIVLDNRIIATGYNGVPGRMPHCKLLGYCQSPDIPYCAVTKRPSVAIHAEVNAIGQCAKFGLSAGGSTIYVTYAPCLSCLKAIISAGIKKIYYHQVNPSMDEHYLFYSKQVEVNQLIYVRED